MTMKTKIIGAFVSIDAGGQWHATIPTKGNRWIDMPGAAMGKLMDLVIAGNGGDAPDEEQTQVIEDSRAQITSLSREVYTMLDTGDVVAAQDVVQQVLDGFPFEDYADAVTGDEDGSAEQIRDALQAFVDVNPDDFLEQAAAEEANGEGDTVSPEDPRAAAMEESGLTEEDLYPEIPEDVIATLPPGTQVVQPGNPSDVMDFASDVPLIVLPEGILGEGDSAAELEMLTWVDGKFHPAAGGEGFLEGEGFDTIGDYIQGIQASEDMHDEIVGHNIAAEAEAGAVPEGPDDTSPEAIRKAIADLEKDANVWQGGDTEQAAERTKLNRARVDAEIALLENLLGDDQPKSLKELRKKVQGSNATEAELREVLANLYQGGYISDSDIKLRKQLEVKLAELKGFDPEKAADFGAGFRKTALGNGWTMTEEDPKRNWGGYRKIIDNHCNVVQEQSGTDSYLDREQTLQAIGDYLRLNPGAIDGDGDGRTGIAEENDDNSLALGAQGMEMDRERASLVASGGKTKRKLAAPVKPPAAWFENPNFRMGTPLTVTKEGRVFGHLALWGTCHAAYANASGDCIVVPGSNADYAMFHLGVVETAEGNEVPVGRLAMETTHADDAFSSRRAIAHYENTGLAIADIHCGEDEFGIWFSGALRPDATETQIRSLKASPLSGDWRYYPQTNDLELVMALAVNMPGFAVPRPKFMVASGAVRSLVAAGMLPPKQIPRAKVEAAKAGDQLAIDDIKYLQKLAARERANEAKILKQRALVASGVPNKIHAMAALLKGSKSVEGKK